SQSQTRYPPPISKTPAARKSKAVRMAPILPRASTRARSPQVPEPRDSEKHGVLHQKKRAVRVDTTARERERSAANTQAGRDDDERRPDPDRTARRPERGGAARAPRQTQAVFRLRSRRGEDLYHARVRAPASRRERRSRGRSREPAGLVHDVASPGTIPARG